MEPLEGNEEHPAGPWTPCVRLPESESEREICIYMSCMEAVLLGETRKGMRKREEGRGMIHQGCGFWRDLALVQSCGEPWRTALPHGVPPWAKGVGLLFLSPC